MSIKLFNCSSRFVLAHAVERNNVMLHFGGKSRLIVFILHSKRILHNFEEYVSREKKKEFLFQSKKYQIFISFFYFQLVLGSMSRKLYDLTLLNYDKIFQRRSPNQKRIPLRFQDFQVHLPSSWMNQADCLASRNLVASFESSTKNSDITVTGPHPIFGSQPIAKQFGGCGTRGQGVDLPYTYLELNTGEFIYF